MTFLENKKGQEKREAKVLLNFLGYNERGYNILTCKITI
jgi:hypothetical protein